jgi:hypothetical protein
VLLNEVANTKTIFIFRTDKKLLISENGIVSKGSWEYLGHNSLLFETNKQTLLLKHSFADEHVMAFKIDGTDGFLFLRNAAKFDEEIYSIERVVKFLENKYCKNDLLNNSFSLNSHGIPVYSETSKKRIFNFTLGRHDKIYIFFADGISGSLFKGYATKRYFFYHSKLGKKYCYDKDECISELYKNKRYDT